MRLDNNKIIVFSIVVLSIGIVLVVISGIEQELNNDKNKHISYCYGKYEEYLGFKAEKFYDVVYCWDSYKRDIVIKSVRR